MTEVCHPERSEGAETRFGPFALLRVTSLTIGLFTIACASPEAGRHSGQPGADIRNWGRPVEIHAGADPYHDTPCVEPIKCTGPMPVFGPTPPPD
jgi:hypothetical protein